MWKTIDLVPDSIASDPQVIAVCEAIDIELAQIYFEIPPINFWPNIEDQVGAMLDIMAWEMHVDIYQGWKEDLTDDQKIALILESIEWHQHKGTPWVVEQMLKEIFVEGNVLEWFEYRARPVPVGNPIPSPVPPGTIGPPNPLPIGPGYRYKFALDIGEFITDPEDVVKVTKAINAVKNLRSWIDEELGFVQRKSSKLQMYIGVYNLQWMRTTVPMLTYNPPPTF